ncbi:MAG: hypothetical protein L6R40_007536 [Gallowayella cf. fulva]|nr:MAG: hypothetical protein L6R40_007536 [Xanthomendoza cf. fulva]
MANFYVASDVVEREQDMISGIPLELRLLISSFLTKKDQRNVRIVSKSLEEAVTPILFSELTIRAHMTASEWSQRPSFAALGFKVKTLYITTVEYQYPSVELSEELNALDECPSKDTPHLQQAHDIYQELRVVHGENLGSGDFLAHLSVLLSSMPQLHKVVLTGDSRAMYDTYQELYRICGLPGCESVTPEDHEKLAIPPRAGLLTLATTHLQLLMSALSAARAPIEELSLGDDDVDMAIEWLAVQIPSSRLHHTIDVLSKLKKLRLNVWAPWDTAWNDDISLNNVASFSASTLSYAKNLLHLRVRGNWDPADDLGDFDRLLGGCTLPNLRTCVLSGLRGTLKALLNFLEACPYLTQLTLCDFELEGGAWEQFFADLPPSLRLASIKP